MQVVNSALCNSKKWHISMDHGVVVMAVIVAVVVVVVLVLVVVGSLPTTSD